jgi:hypothetical protein
MRPTRLPPAAATLLLLLPLPLAACAEVGTYGAAAIEQRRVMNDLQARATMAATCDIALGAYFRELSDAERRYVGLVCGGMFPRPPAEEGAAPTPRAPAAAWAAGEGEEERPRLRDLPPLPPLARLTP